MNIINITDDNMTLFNRADDDDNIMLEISPLFLIIAIIPCALSIICCLSFLSYGFIEVLINKK